MEKESYLSWLMMLLVLFMEFLQSDCQCTEFVSPMPIQTFGTSVGTIQVPRAGRNKYRSNQACEWTIETDFTGYGIRLDLIKCALQGRDINGDCNNDYVDVYDVREGNNVFLGRSCGLDRGKSFTSSGNKMTVRFYSDAVLEFSGFQAQYQSVLLGPSTEQQDEDRRKMMNMAIGIPIGVLAMGVVIICALLVARRLRLRKPAARPAQTPATAAGASHASHGLPGGYPTLDSSMYVVGPCMYPRDRAGDTGFDHCSANLPLQVALPTNVHYSSRNSWSAMPPPAYDSLDFGHNEGGPHVMPMTPPPYEMVVKQHMEPKSD